LLTVIIINYRLIQSSYYQLFYNTLQEHYFVGLHVEVAKVQRRIGRKNKAMGIIYTYKTISLAK